MGNVEATVSPLLSLCLLVKLGDHGVVFLCSHFINGCFDFRDGVTADWSMSGMQSIDVILAEYLRWLGNLAEQVLKMYLVPGSST